MVRKERVTQWSVERHTPETQGRVQVQLWLCSVAWYKAKTNAGGCGSDAQHHKTKHTSAFLLCYTGHVCKPKQRLQAFPVSTALFTTVHTKI